VTRTVFLFMTASLCQNYLGNSPYSSPKGGTMVSRHTVRFQHGMRPSVDSIRPCCRSSRLLPHRKLRLSATGAPDTRRRRPLPEKMATYIISLVSKMTVYGSNFLGSCPVGLSRRFVLRKDPTLMMSRASSLRVRSGGTRQSRFFRRVMLFKT